MYIMARFIEVLRVGVLAHEFETNASEQVMNPKRKRSGHEKMGVAMRKWV